MYVPATSHPASPLARIGLATISILFGVFALNGADSGAYSVGNMPLSMLVLASTFLFSLALLAFCSSAEKMSLSLQLMLIYMSIYLLLPGYSHSSINEFPFYRFSYDDSVRTQAAVMAMAFVLCVSGAYFVSAPATVRQSRDVTVSQNFYVRHNVWLSVPLTAGAAIAAVVLVAAIGFAGAFSVRSMEASGIETSATGLIVGLPRVVVFFPIIYAISLIRGKLDRRSGWWLLLINLPFLLIVDWPPAQPRSQVFGNLLLFSLLLFDFRRVPLRIVLSLAFIVGALVAMPLLDHFTRQGGSLADLDLRQVFSAYFRSGDFDGLQSINNSVIYVERNGLEYGRQIVSALLFFVPRAVWAGKGEPTGSITADAAGYTFTNVSQPLPSEFFVDFGWPGVVIGGILLGWGLRRIDAWISAHWYTTPRARVVAGFIVGFALPIYRGTLLGVIAPFALLGVGIWLICRFGLDFRHVFRSADVPYYRPHGRLVNTRREPQPRR